MKDGTEVPIRPIGPDDAEMEKEFIQRLSEDSAFNRFFGVPEELTSETIARFCNVDYEKEMALVAEMRDAPGRIIVGVARLAETTMRRGEFALVVSDEFQRGAWGESSLPRCSSSQGRGAWRAPTQRSCLRTRR